ncbi:hypothetical protein [Litoreibacter janthinus]|uniref:Uncharacterized protein n=1 Tax=Litoreibacter janthinus TaxID=670154 RepID=A0A1I6GPR9_9RHOB|nr:hypothetical protein [Litoreibacter janthinus]SFR44223.1 hypothetical protein SAMN04488002_1817 [Litoreibacter janthinus]
MLKFLFRGREKDVVVETQRQSFERIVSELNAAIDGLSVKPRITLDPATGHVDLHLPEQLPDEALALPAPTDEAEQVTEETAEPENTAESKVA